MRLRSAFCSAYMPLVGPFPPGDATGPTLVQLLVLRGLALLDILVQQQLPTKNPEGPQLLSSIYSTGR
jgi:hypothetical protein